ncbi:MAG: NADH-quinone oxidoreductase subunit K [Thermoguttaceae bacterium]
MNLWLELTLVSLILANLHLLGSSRINACIRTVALQAVLLSVVSLLVQPQHIGPRLLGLAAASMAIKAGLLPWLLRRAVREANVQTEVEPIVGFTTSLLLGLGLLGFALHVAGRLPLADAHGAEFLVATALFTVLIGLLLIVGRRKAVMQTVGYLAMENGIYAFGLAFAVEEPLLVEMGVLLDVFVAVFVMGIAIHHISREFDHIDTDRLSALKD